MQRLLILVDRAAHQLSYHVWTDPQRPLAWQLPEKSINDFEDLLQFSTMKLIRGWEGFKTSTTPLYMQWGLLLSGMMQHLWHKNFRAVTVSFHMDEYN